MTTIQGTTTPSKHFDETFELPGLEIIQNPNEPHLRMYNGTVDSTDLIDIVSIDNPVSWDANSQTWKNGGRNRTIEAVHWKSIRDYLQSATSMLPSPIIISVADSAFSFSAHPNQKTLVSGVQAGVISIRAPFLSIVGQRIPVDEDKRVAWVVDGQHRIKALRELRKSMPINVLIIKQWAGPTYDDVMRHQTYELNMGRPLSEDFRAAVREGYKALLGGDSYKREIAVSWIRKDLESRGGAFGPQVVGAPKLRTPYKIRMSLVESLIRSAYVYDTHLATNHVLTTLNLGQVKLVGDQLFSFFEGVRLSLGLIAKQHRSNFGGATNYWDVATIRNNPQRLLHNVGLKAITRGLLYEVMRKPGTSGKLPSSPQDVANRLAHMKGIPWHDPQLMGAKDEWVKPLSDALKKMYGDPDGTSKGKVYQLDVTRGTQSMTLTCQW